jgi:hypothetical protein
MKNKLLQISAFLFIVAISMLLGITNVKAQDSVYIDNEFFTYKKHADNSNGNFSYQINLQECGNQVLFATIYTYADGHQFSDVMFNGVNMTSAISMGNYIGGHRAVRWQSYYLVNPDIGNLYFAARNTRGQYSDPMTIHIQSLCNVDSVNPLQWANRYGGDVGTTITTNYIEIANNNSFILSNHLLPYGSYNGYTPTSTSQFSQQIYDPGGANCQSKFYYLTENAKTSLNYYTNTATCLDCNNRHSLDVFVFNYDPATPAEYCGDTFCQTATENCATCPIDCGECASNPNVQNLGLFFFYNPYTFSNQSTAVIRYLYNEDVFTHYDHIEVRKMNTDWTESTFIATSTIMDISGLSLGKRDGKSYFTLTGDGETNGYEYYEVIGHLAPYWSPTLGDVEATTTIPYMVIIKWQPTEIPTVADILAASSTNPFYDDAVMYEAACSEEDWNTPPPEIFGVDVPALNLTVIGCKFKLGLIIAGNKFTTIATDGIYRAGNILKNVFPFNIYTNLNSSWKNSASATVMAELAFLSPVDGNLTAQIPTTGTSTATIVLWGKDIFTSSSTLGTVNAEKTNQLFLAIKTIIRWALWGLFGLWAIKNGKAFIDKMTGGQ